MLDKEILMAMEQFKVDSYGRPAGRTTGYYNGKQTYIILPMDSLSERLSEYGLTPTLYAVFQLTSFGPQQVTPWYLRYGNAVKAMVNCKHK